MSQQPEPLTVTSEYGDVRVITFLPFGGAQAALAFHPGARVDGLKSVSRRDLAIVRAMLQDALDDVDDERHRRLRDEAAAAHGLPPQVVAPRPAPGHGPGTW